MSKRALKNLVIYIEKDENGVFIGSVPSIQSCYAEGKTMKEMTKNLEQVLKLCIRNAKKTTPNTFVGIQSLDSIYA